LALQRGRFRGRQSSLRRRKAWELGPGGVTAQTGIASSVAIIVTSTVSTLLDGLTVMRIRGSLELWLGTSNGAAGGFAGAFGIAKASTAAVAAGAASVPTPVTEQSWDGWMYWQSILIKSHGVIDGTVSNDGDAINAVTAAQRIIIDTKAMRKTAIDESIYACLEVTEAGTATMEWHMDSRMLVALP